MKIFNYYLGEEPPPLTLANVDDAKLSYRDRRRKANAERRREMATTFRNTSGRLK